MRDNRRTLQGNMHRSLNRRDLLKNSGLLGGMSILPMSSALSVLAGGPAFAQDADDVAFQLGWVKSIQHGGHFAALENGNFAEEGIDAEFVSGGPNTELEGSVAGKQVMMSDTDVLGPVFGRAIGMPIKAIAAIMQRTPEAIMSLAENPIVELGDLVDKTVAVPPSRRAQLASLLMRADIDPASVRFVPVGTDPGMLAAGQVDGYFGWASNQGVMLKVRGVDIATAYLNDWGVPGYAGVIIAREDTIDEQSDLLIRFLRADIRGWQWHMDNPEEMAKLMVEKYGQAGLDLEAQTVESKLMNEFITIGDAAEHGLLWIDPAIFEAGITFARESGDLAADVEITADQVVTQDLIKAAHASM